MTLLRKPELVLMFVPPLSAHLDGILPRCTLLIDVLKSTHRECQPVVPATAWQKDLDNQDKSLKAQFSFAFHLTANRTWRSGEDKQRLSLLNSETSRQKRLACGQTGMWADKETERHVHIKEGGLNYQTERQDSRWTYHNRQIECVWASLWEHAGVTGEGNLHVYIPSVGMNPSISVCICI